MGNRGVLHDEHGTLGPRRWTNPAWITCRLEFKGRRRPMMAPNSWTELFFLDEAVAVAAGHRPCRQCRRADYEAFRDAWHAGNPGAGVLRTDRVAALDRLVHAERVRRDRSKVTFRAFLNTLPDGVFVELDGRPGEAWLVWRGQLHRYAPDGYAERIPRPRGWQVTVLTPRSYVAAIAAGYVPAVHDSVEPGRDELLELAVR